MRKILFFIFYLFSIVSYGQDIYNLKVDTFLKINSIGNKFLKNIYYCDSCLLKFPIELRESKLFESQFLLQIINKKNIFYDSTVHPFEITTLSYNSEKKIGYLEILYVHLNDTSYQKGKFYLSDTVFNGYYKEEKTNYKYYKLIKDSVWNIGTKGEYYTYKKNMLHGKYQSYGTPAGETGNYLNDHLIGVIQWYDSDDMKLNEDYYDNSGNFIYEKQYKTVPAKFLYKETYKIINDKVNSTDKNVFDYIIEKLYFKEYNQEGFLICEGFKKWNKKKDNYEFYGLHKYYSQNKLVKTIQYDNNGNAVLKKNFK